MTKPLTPCRVYLLLGFWVLVVLVAAPVLAQSDASSFVNQSVPNLTMVAGRAQSVWVRFTNTGTSTWTRAGSYKLGSQNPQDNVNWGTNRVYMGSSDSVVPNQSYAFTFTITAPLTPGSYNFQWRMIQETSTGWFGPTSTNVVIRVIPDDSQFVNQSVPNLTMVAGTTQSVWVRFTNTGTSTWTRAGSYKLGSQNPQDNVNWGTNRVYMGSSDSVVPNQSYAFTFTITAPLTPGSYNFQWRMIQETSTGWFGPTSTNVVIRVIPDDSQFVNQSVPNLTMVAGTTQSVWVRFTNTGTSTWTRAGSYKLGSQNPQDNVNWGTNRVYMDPYASVAPNQSYAFTFTITAPLTPGSYNFQWRMIQETSTGWFGPTSTNVVIRVIPDDSQFVNQSVPNLTMVAGTTQSVWVRFTNTGTSTWTRAGSYKLGSQNPQDNVNWGTSRVYMDPSASVPRGATYTFVFTITAPSTLGDYDFQWRMIQETSTGWFGSSTPSVRIHIVSNSATFLWQSVPARMMAGSSQLVSITFQNTGTSTWTWSGSYNLGSQNPRDNTVWGTGRAYMDSAASIAPGQKYTFRFGINAPLTPGVYSFQWQMLQEGIAWFGQPSSPLTIDVRPHVEGCLAPDAGSDDAARIQTELSAGRSVALCPWTTWLIRSFINFDQSYDPAYRALSVSTMGLPTDDSRALLKLDTNFDPELAMMFRANGVGNDKVQLLNIMIDGSGGRSTANFGQALIQFGAKPVDPNAGDSGQVVDHVKAWNPRGWTILVMEDAGLQCQRSNTCGPKITNNEFGPTGVPTGAADGISLKCNQSTVTGNKIADVTDGAIVLFGASGSLIDGNEIRQTSQNNLTLGMGICLSDFGDYTNVVVSNNRIYADSPIHIGIAMGGMVHTGHCTTPTYLSGAKVINNELHGQHMGYGYLVDGVKNWEVTGNLDFSTHGGTFRGVCPPDPPDQPNGFLRHSLHCCPDAGDTCLFQVEFVEGIAHGPAVVKEP